MGLATVAAADHKPVSPCEFPTRTVPTRHRLWTWVASMPLILSVAMGSPLAPAQSAEATQSATGASLLSIPPRSWVVDAAANELVALHHKGSYLRYRMETVNERGNQVRDVIESKDGTVARLILKDGKPLTPEQDKAERQRLNDMLASPAAFGSTTSPAESSASSSATPTPPRRSSASPTGS